MKLNLWQWIGLILLIIAVVLIARRRLATSDVVQPQSTVPPTSAPASTQ
jgi:drug/metabolite transporter (DMT)-like permease